MIELEIPAVKVLQESNNLGKYLIEPLLRGWGNTIGNSLRRVLLSSIPSYAIHGVIIDGVYHQFETINGVVQSVLEICLNLKKVRLKPIGQPDNIPFSYKITVSDKEVLKAGDLVRLSGMKEFEVVNPDLVICEMDKGTTLKMEFFVSKGFGYLPADYFRESIQLMGFIPIDAVYSPVTRVTYTTEELVTGKFPKKEKLIIEVETDGSVSPSQAFNDAISTLVNMLNSVRLVPYPGDGLQQKPVTTAEQLKSEVLERSIYDLGLSTRVLKKLTQLGVRTLGDLAKMTKKELKSIKGVGITSLLEIEQTLRNFGLEFKDE